MKKAGAETPASFRVTSARPSEHHTSADLQTPRLRSVGEAAIRGAEAPRCRSWRQHALGRRVLLSRDARGRPGVADVENLEVQVQLNDAVMHIERKHLRQPKVRSIRGRRVDAVDWQKRHTTIREANKVVVQQARGTGAYNANGRAASRTPGSQRGNTRKLPVVDEVFRESVVCMRERGCPDKRIHQTVTLIERAASPLERVGAVVGRGCAAEEDRVRSRALPVIDFM